MVGAASLLAAAGLIPVRAGRRRSSQPVGADPPAVRAHSPGRRRSATDPDGSRRLGGHGQGAGVSRCRLAGRQLGVTNELDVIVVGGGLAGLTAGAVAVQAGLAALVLEAHAPGGRARIVERDRFIFNMGAHALYLGGPALAVLRSLGIDPVGNPPPLGRYRALSGGRLHGLPTGPASLLRTTALGLRSKAKLTEVLAQLPWLRAPRFAGVSVAAWLASYDLRPDAESVLRALLRLGTYAADVDDFAADAAISQMRLAATDGVVYLDGGWAQLTDRLAGLVEVRPATKVTHIGVAAGRVEVSVLDGSTLVARRVILAPGTPAAARALLASDPGWGDVGSPVVAACLDLGVSRVPDPGYVLSLDEPLYATVQSPPARQAPEGGAVVAAVRYGTRTAKQDRPALEDHLATAGVRSEDIVVSRFLANMVVAGAAPRAGAGGLSGRPRVTSTGLPGVYLAGDWVGGEGLLADASLASARTAAILAARDLRSSPTTM